jgi:DNA transposition AAA+ family ATPase
MKDVFVPTDNYQRLQEECEACLADAHGVELVAVRGRAGRGKSTAAERIVVENPDARFVRFEEGMTPLGLLKEVTFVCTGERPFFWEKCRALLATELSRRRILLVVDEIDRGSMRHLNALRDLHDLFSVPVVMIGEEPLLGMLQKERRLISRTRKIITFEPVAQSDVIYYFRTAVGQTLDPKDAAEFTRHSGGDFRQVVTDALAAERYLKVNGLKRITDDVVRMVCSNGARP